MRRTEEWLEFEKQCRAQRIYPVDLSSFLSHFEPRGSFPRADGLRIICDMVREGVLVFDGNAFYMASEVKRYGVDIPRHQWGEEDVMHARCLGAGSSTPPRYARRLDGETSLPAGL